MKMQRLNISQVDAIFANGSYPIEFLLYYKNGLEIKKIRSALRRLSPAFWPMFGEYDAGVIHFDKYSEKECFAEELIEAEFDPGETNQAIYKTYGHIIPPDLKKLSFFKIIQHTNGAVLIPKMNHLAGDGYSYFYFLSLLAAVSRGISVPLKSRVLRILYKPHHRRTALKEFQFNGLALAPLPARKKLAIEFEKIPRNTVRNLIKKVSSDLGRQVSANDILSAMVLKKSVEMQKDRFGDTVQLTIPIDVRNQVKEYGPRYFGNGLTFGRANFKTGEVAEWGVERIATEIRKCMPAVTAESFREYLNSLEALIATGKIGQLRPYDPETGCLVTNLSKLPTQQLDFGTGNPDFIFPLTIGKNSAAILAEKDNFILRLVY